MWSGQSLVWKCSWQTVSSWGCSSAQHYWTWQTGCSPDCLNLLGWRWLCSLLRNKQKNPKTSKLNTSINMVQLASLEHLTHVWQHFDAGLNRRLLDRVEPATVVDPEYALKELNKYWLTGLKERQDAKGKRLWFFFLITLVLCASLHNLSVCVCHQWVGTRRCLSQSTTWFLPPHRIVYLSACYSWKYRKKYLCYLSENDGLLQEKKFFVT